MADYTPIFTGGAIPFTSQASATTTGGQLVEVTGNNTVGPAAAAATDVVGVAAHDAASGAKLLVWPLKNVTHEVISAGVVAAGDQLAAGAAGTVATAAITPGTTNYVTVFGVALAGAASGALTRFLGR